jgi:hypothetical protein
MTTKTVKTLVLIDRLAGVPHLLRGSPHVVVPCEAWFFYELRQPPDFREWWQIGREKYDAGLLFKIK